MLDNVKFCLTIVFDYRMLPFVKQRNTMGSNMENETSTKIATSLRLETVVYTALADMAAAQNRPSQANMMEHLIKTNSEFQPFLERRMAEAKKRGRWIGVKTTT